MQPKQAGIIVVEPVPIVRRKIASLLVANGMAKVTSLETPSQALELLETKPCHIVFSEWRFPDASGLDFLGRLRSHPFPRVSKIRFVVLTADGSEASVNEAMNAGADDYILKPLTDNQILSRVNALLINTAADQ
jgi:DNA-binding NarL/FixJ family response regulator